MEEIETVRVGKDFEVGRHDIDLHSGDIGNRCVRGPKLDKVGAGDCTGRHDNTEVSVDCGT